ncbi:hypothetical protein ABG768_024605 [Culter alburnus]|uniref:Butyrophilin subfamily 1 member A1-like n=1 Tax=Culter alburnus TaxID=194366 RepID=A0AAW2AEV0_CULAL
MLSIIIIALLVNLLIEASVSFTVVVPRDQIVAHVGSTVTLPCWISPPENAEALEIRWYRHDQFSNPVLFYQHEKIQDLQDESYRNRSSLTLRSDQSGGLKDGDVSLRLEKLTVQDEGSFYCYVSGDTAYDSSKVVLKITELSSSSDPPVSSDPWKALFFTLLITALLGLFGLILYKYRHKLTEQKRYQRSTCLKAPVKNASGLYLSNLLSSFITNNFITVGDVNIEDLRKHAVQITIDREHLHPDLKVSKDCKSLRDSSDYKHTGEGFPYQLCAFGAQIFTSGRHYWEVSLAWENTPPKNYWLIGVVKHGNFTAKYRSALIPSDGFWCLCSDGPKGFYTNSDQSLTLSLTPRPERLGVLLDYDDGQLSFYNVKEKKHLLTMSTRFTGSVVPLFNPGVGDQSSLIILDCPKPVESPVESRMLSIFIALLVNFFIETSVSFTVVVPRDQIVAHVGSTVTLPCWISPPEKAEALEIRWYRHDQFSNPVLFYQYGKIKDLQEESYRNRTSLTRWSDQSGGLKDGDVSLQLEKLTVQDEGLFHCYVSGESTYGSQEMVLKVIALGSAPVLFPQPLDDGRVNISCRSSGWYPELNIMWMSDERTALHPGGVSSSRGADEMFSVHSWTVVSHSDTQLVSCSMSLKTGEFREGRLNIQAIISSDSSDPWKALFFTLLICALLGLVGLILYKYRHKLTGLSIDVMVFILYKLYILSPYTTSTPSPKPSQETFCIFTFSIKHFVGDVNLEELRKHADQISIDREHSHPDLRVSKDCKSVRDSPDYNHTGEGFPYQLCAFGDQRFTSGRHYWEVSLALENTPPKNYWLIGVVKHGHFSVKDKSALTPSNGYWFLCSDGPKGFYISSDPPVKLSLTPRPERLGVLLDYDDGQLSFYNVKEKKHLLTMSTRFTGSVVPLFNPGVGDQSTLKILDCPKPEESPVESSQPLLSNSSKPEDSSVEFSQNSTDIVAHVGSTVTLPCWISPPENAEALEIRWYHHDQFSNPVLFYQHEKIQDVQEESYRN